uniref:Glycosyltransferase 2-like domain-containing protein n=1 Tax=Oncorhynchus mykiss TaxID=8022 RepID=A0A8K9US54_ONCMY
MGRCKQVLVLAIFCLSASNTHQMDWYALDMHMRTANCTCCSQETLMGPFDHPLRTSSSLNRLILAPSNTPLQYPIQGFTVFHRSGKWSICSTFGLNQEGQGEKEITVQSTSLYDLNNLLGRLTYTSTVYRMRTGDLGKAIDPAFLPYPYSLIADINDRVTIVTKTFLRYTELQVLISSIRTYYKDIKIIIADDSLEPQKVNGSNIEQYIMPPAQGWFAGRNLAVSQVTTKYFLWVDDDFLFTDKTKIENLVEVMEATPELDVVGGSVAGHGQFYFSLVYEEGNGEDGGCLNRKGAVKYQPVPGFPTCSFTSGVVNLFLGRTDAVRKVGFDPRLKRVAHSEFFMDGLGSLLVASCSHVSIGHQPKIANAKYSSFRRQKSKDLEDKLAHHFFKNHLKCILLCSQE